MPTKKVDKEKKEALERQIAENKAQEEKLVKLVKPQLKWSFYAAAGVSVCGLWPLFSPDALSTYLLRNCDKKDADAVTPLLNVVIQIVAATAVVQSKLFRQAASNPSNIDFQSLLAQATAGASGFAVATLCIAESSGQFPNLLPATIVFALSAAFFAGNLNRLRWGASIMPKDPKEMEAMGPIESEYERGVLVEWAMWFPVPLLTRVFQAHAAVCFIGAGSAFFLPDVWATILANRLPTPLSKSAMTVLEFMVRFYGALTAGNFWVCWRATRHTNSPTRKRIVESFAAMITAQVVILGNGMWSGLVSWLLIPSAVILTAVGVVYWACYVDKDEVKYPEKSSTTPLVAAAAVGASSAASSAPASKATARPSRAESPAPKPNLTH